MTKPSFQDHWNDLHAKVEAHLDTVLSARRDMDPDFLEILRYSVLGGGKRIRPVLCLAATEAAGGNPDDALPAACALELLHAYSLVHDDLPSMDDDDERRGRPTVHKKWDEATAILIGDALQAEAFLLVTERRNWRNTSAETQLTIAREVALSVGSTGMVGGQYLDVSARRRRLDRDQVETLHRLKTGALIRAAAVCGGLVAGAAPLELAALSQFGAAVGLLFQQTDDLLDADELEAGATAADMSAEAAVNFAALLGHDALQVAIGESRTRALEAIDVFSPRDAFLRGYAEFIADRTH